MSNMSSRVRRWTGNDRNARIHHGVVFLSESPLKMHLSWKQFPEAPACFIGEFDLDLYELLAEGLVRLESGRPEAVRLRFYHGFDDVIYIQTCAKNPGRPIGKTTSR